MVGFAPEQEMKFRFDVATGLFERDADRLARLVAELGDASTANLFNGDLLLSDAERKSARDALGALADGPPIVSGPGTKNPAKDWGQDNWQTLLGRIEATYPGHGLALVGLRRNSRSPRRQHCFGRVPM